MVKIKYIQPDGRNVDVEVQPGISLMEAAVKNNVPGIEAQCGGACACATCHVYLDDSWQTAAGEPAIMEQSMLEFASHSGPGSRLACQITVTDALNGLVVRIPISQG
jgi:2Fe-2S ferredoxin